MRKIAANLAGTLAGLVTLCAGIASAQTGDFSALKGGPARKGHTVNTDASSPGRAFRTWFAPQTASPLSASANVTQIDNTDFTYGDVLAGAAVVQDGSPRGISLTPDPSKWVAPATIFDVAQPFIRPYNVAKNPSLGLRNPPYVYTRGVLSTPYTNTSLPAPGPTAGATASWTFRFFGAGAFATSPTAGYALYVHLPLGPTTIGGSSVYQQRYVVYTVKSGTRFWTDIVDTQAAGTGWIRLGNGGQSTNQVFGYNGTDPVEITVYNTVPRKRHVLGNLDDTTLDSADRLIYVDAAKAIPIAGYNVSSPIAVLLNPADTTTATVFQASNNLTISNLGDGRTYTQGALTAYYTSNADTTKRGTARWTYSPIDNSPSSSVIDNTSLSIAGSWTTSLLAHYAGTDCLITPAKTATNELASIQLDSTITTDQYSVFVYSPGDQGAVLLSKHQFVEVNENGVAFSAYIDMSVPGWHQIGTRRFYFSPTSSLKITVGSQTTNAADEAQNRFAYCDAIRIVGQSDLGLRSTPVFYANALIKPDAVTAPAAKNIVIVGDEAGRLHCLDANGNADGTTTEYWSYPSTPDKTNPLWTDPNFVSGQDGIGGIAEMPSSFNLSSALITTIPINGVDTTVMYIGGDNGRVYCINVTGRGDFSVATHVPGTTQRVWTYPSTYPSTITTPRSQLGGFIGSVSLGTVPSPIGGNPPIPVIYAPASQGRMYCLDATGRADKSTLPVWMFPAAASQTLGGIVSTPSLEFGNIYFGTEVATNEPNATDKFVNGRGGFYCVNAVSGGLVWWKTVDNAGTEFEEFTSGPATSAYTELGDNVSAGGQVYALNANRFMYAFDALTGTEKWSTDEMGGTSVGSLGFTKMNVFSNDGIEGGTYAPVVTAALVDGRLWALFAKTADVNRHNARQAWQYNTQGTVSASIATANGFMFGADEDGYLYAFSDVKGIFGSDDFFPGSDVIVENNPAGDVFKKAKIKLISKDAYRTLVSDDVATLAQRNYAFVNGGASNSTRASNAYEWGETVYAVIYDFPFINKAKTGDDIASPTVTISINVNGRSIRSFPTESRQMDGAGLPVFYTAVPSYLTQPANKDSYIPHPALWFDSATVDDGSSTDPLTPVGFPINLNYIPMNGYALVAFPIQGSGTQSLPPGQANITYSLTTAALTGTVLQTFSPNPNLGFGRIGFAIGNPLGISMGLNGAGAPIDNLSIGNPLDPAAPENQQNGSRNVAGKLTSKLLASAGLGVHGQTSLGSMWVFDRSYMSLLRPNDPTSTDPRGLDQVRAIRRELGWQGGGFTVRKSFDPTIYPSFEDLPLNFPNTSIDYPNLKRENVNLTKDPNGDAENPIFGPVTLKAPMVKEGGVFRPLKDTDDPTSRTFRPTLVQIGVDVPRFQPSNTMVNDAGTTSADIFFDSAGRSLPQGYIGRFDFFVDSDQTGQLSRALRKASRGFSISTAVAMDEHLTVTTPQVDLGSLPNGAGLTANGLSPTGMSIQNYPARPDEAALALNPWNAAYAGLFASFNVLNDGNVNILNARVAKGDARTATIYPWSFSSASNDNLAWLDATSNLWSDLDPRFNIGSGFAHIIPKPRVGDTYGIALTANPRRRANNILGTTGFFGALPDVLDVSTDLAGNLLHPPVPPRIGVSAPPGFPSGTYSSTIRVIEKRGALQNFWEAVSPNNWEAYSDPTLVLTFTIRESRLTNRPTQKSATMMENILDPNWPNNPAFGAPAARSNSPFAFQNMQPSAFRNQKGAVYVAWATDRDPSATLGGGDASIGPVSANSTGNTRISVGSLGSGASFTVNGFTTPVAPTAVPAPLRDFDFWNHSSASWFNYNLIGYPGGSSATLFGGTIVPGTDSYYAPSFPTMGDLNQFDPSVFYGNVYMAFAGRAQKQTASGRSYESRIFLTTMSSDASGSASPGSVSVLEGDPFSEKGRPSVIQTATGAMLFYPSTSSGKTSINYARYRDGAFGPVSAINFGSGFDSVDSPSATGRTYVGTDPGKYGAGVGQKAYSVDMTFAGRLRGRANQEIFAGALAMPSGGSAAAADRLIEDGTGNISDTPWIFQNAQSERLAGEANGSFRSRGVSWNRNVRIQLTMTRQGFSPVNILLDGYDAVGVYTALNDTRQYDKESGLISYGTSLGGRVYMDPNLGVVRFGSAVVDKSAELRLSYQPLFVRISTGNVGSFARPVGLLDNHYISNESMWFNNINAPLPTGSAVTNDRFVYTYNRSAVGSGQGARPFMATMRFGVRLAYRVFVSNGAPQITVLGANGPYQVDPANGRVYFTAIDEDNPSLDISYTGINDSTGAATGLFRIRAGEVVVAKILEQAEQPVPIEQASNESSLCTFLDPFSFLNTRRPPLMWMFWTSTRGGVPDLYFQTIAPQFAPVLNRG